MNISEKKQKSVMTLTQEIAFVTFIKHVASDIFVILMASVKHVASVAKVACSVYHSLANKR